jgi:23S rRNA (cytosine1962-C5)-methyltransferase
VSGQPLPGREVRVVDSRGKFLGYGFFNPASKIRVRIFSRIHPEADVAFFEETFRSALAHRSRFFDISRQSLRMIFGEADSVPGLIVDRFVGRAQTSSGEDSGATPGTWLSTQFLSLGVEIRKAEILEALVRVFAPDGIFERSDAHVRLLEGLESASGTLAGDVPASILMEENGASFSIDISGGQKTGWFLDQRANRAAAARFAPGARVLDAFCNQGGFGILCAKAGAVSVMAVDSSAAALEAARKNSQLNGVDGLLSAVEANAFDHLRNLERENAKFDLVVLDPPAFAKSRATIEPAHRGYREINVRAMHLIQRGGILLTCSCSHWFDDERFDAMLAESASDCGRRFRTIEERSQDLDHPIVSGYGESRYLKCRILEML